MFGSSTAFADLALRPDEITKILIGASSDFTDLGKLFTAMFMHGSIAHLVGNMLFLMTFGPNVEASFGSSRFAFYYVFWGIVAFVAQIFVDPHSKGAVLGASGALGGVLGAYFLLFPGNRIKVLIPPIFWWTFDLSAFWLLGVWFVMQIIWPQDGVATWAHAGGFMAGMFIVLVMGGRQKVLMRTKFEEDEEFENG